MNELPILDHKLKLIWDRLEKDQPQSTVYQPPSTQDITNFLRGLHLLFDGKALSLPLAELGFSMVSAVDGQTRRPYLLISSEQGPAAGWGSFLLDTSCPVRYTIGIPHPKSDLKTELIGLDLWRKLPGSLLIISGTHRHAVPQPPDPAHDAATLFHHVVADGFEHNGQKLDHIQLHGFKNSRMPGVDTVISSGLTNPGTAVKRLAQALQSQSFVVATNWDGKTNDLLGKKNVQGQLAHKLQTTFIHIEMSYSLRNAPDKWQLLNSVAANSLLNS